MNTVKEKTSWALFISVLIIAIFAAVAYAQKSPVYPTPVLWEDTSINPHDFSNEFYAANGILSKAIIGRRTGTDMLSVFSPSSNPMHTNVRVIATLPAYGPNEEAMFWYPLGELNDNGFTDDKMGIVAREAALATPIYIFPTKVSDAAGGNFLSGMRQAALFGPSETYYPEFVGKSPMLRRMVEVSYTAKAYDKESQDMIKFMLAKNGQALDGMPIIRSMNDLVTLSKHELVEFSTKLWDDGSAGAFAISPAIDDPTGGVIAPDAFLLMATIDGKPLPSEQWFATQFGCLRKTGQWCKQ